MKLTHFISIVALFTFSFSANAQVKGGEFDKLFDLYLLEDYEGCLGQALKMSEKDKYSRHPEPLLYASMCYYEISLDPEMTETEEYKDAFKNALKYAYKATKKDKEEYNLMAQNEEYVTNLKVRGAEEGRFHYNEDDFRKAASTYAKLLKVDANDPGMLLFTGVCQLLSKNVGEGDKNVAQALALIKTNFADGSYQPSEVTYEHVVDGIIIYTNYLKDTGEVEKAKDVISSARTSIPQDKDLKVHYDRLIN